jgi:DNA-binding MarR family transcriptional regulator
MNDRLLTRSLLDWAEIFMRFSLNDFSRYTRSVGLSFGQMTVLLHLHYQGACEISRFCELQQITPAGASQMIERLVQLGVVQRSEVPGDRRVRKVELTDHGRRLVEESIAVRQDWVSELVKLLSSAEGEQVYSAMQTLNGHARNLECDQDSTSIVSLPHADLEPVAGNESETIKESIE